MRKTRSDKQGRRPVAAWFIALLLAFLGLTALGGGIELVMFPHGNEFVPGEWLQGVPLVETWLVPGLVLGVVFGLGSLAAMYGVLRRGRWGWLRGLENLSGYHWSWAATWLIGLGMMTWILLELIYIPKRSVIEAIYGGTGLLLTVLPLLPAVRRYLVRPADEA